MEACDVAVIGAGPAGSAAAISLAQRGYEVTLIEKKSFPREKLCGDFINPINWPLFRELGVEHEVLALPHARVSGFRITTTAGREAVAQFTASEHGRSLGLGLRRAYLDQVLLDRAAALGVTVFQGRRLVDLSRAAQVWRLRSEGGEKWQAKIVIGADGRNSWVAPRLGLNKRAAVGGRSVAFQCRLEYAGAIDGKVEIHLFPGGYAGVVGLGDGTLNVCLAIDKRTLARERSAEFVFGRILPHNPFLRDILQRSEMMSELRSVYPVYFPSRRCYGDRALLVGDAARVSEPVTGEGIFFAMRSGLMAAETVDRALRRGDLSAARLQSYRQNFRRVFRARVALNSFLRFAIYRPALLDPFIRLSARHDRVLNSLINTVCAPQGVS
jgi:geranylgeranyl reductase family protein